MIFKIIIVRNEGIPFPFIKIGTDNIIQGLFEVRTWYNVTEHRPLWAIIIYFLLIKTLCKLDFINKIWY